MKNQKLSLLAVVSACLLALSGCSPSDSGDSSGGTTLTGPIADLQGTWITSCYFDGTDYAKSSFKVSGTNVTAKANYYSDASCTSSSYDFDGTYSNLKIGDTFTFSDGTIGYKYISSIQTNIYTTRNSVQTDLFNLSSFCGVSWTINVGMDLLGKNCSGAAIPPKNTTLYNLYNIMGNNLYIGTSNTDVYPTSVNTNVMYVKQ